MRVVVYEGARPYLSGAPTLCTSVHPVRLSCVQVSLADVELCAPSLTLHRERSGLWRAQWV